MQQETSRGTTTLLRRYFIKPGEWEPFLEVWRRIILVRKRHGFKVLFAFVDRKENVFTWAFSYEGDIAAAMARYYKDPDRVELEIVGNYVSDYKITEVEPEVLA